MYFENFFRVAQRLASINDCQTAQIRYVSVETDVKKMEQTDSETQYAFL